MQLVSKATDAFLKAENILASRFLVQSDVLIRSKAFTNGIQVWRKSLITLGNRFLNMVRFQQGQRLSYQTWHPSVVENGWLNKKSICTTTRYLQPHPS